MRNSVGGKRETSVLIGVALIEIELHTSCGSHLESEPIDS